jgi:hypothetical protein
MKQLTITAGEHSMTRLNISTGVSHSDSEFPLRLVSLTPNQSEDLDPVSGQAWLNGFPVRVEALRTDTRKTDPSTLETNRRIRS